MIPTIWFWIFAPYLTALNSPSLIPLCSALLAAALYICLRAFRRTQEHRRKLAFVCGLCGYLLLTQVAAFVVERADRSFQVWFKSDAGVAIGMTHAEVLRAANSRAHLADPPYSMDRGTSDVLVEDFILIPRGLARLDLRRWLPQEITYTLRVNFDKDDRAVKVRTFKFDLNDYEPRR